MGKYLYATDVQHHSIDKNTSLDFDGGSHQEKLAQRVPNNKGKDKTLLMRASKRLCWKSR